jgi:REP element-mobilizing transposase RayT
MAASPLGALASSPASSSLPAANPWRSRGFLPHFDESRLLQALTFRLHDAVPDSVVQGWKQELAWINHLSSSDPRDVELRKRISRYEDAGHGACWLRNERIASLVENTLLHFDGERYRLIAWCIMPNHVHALVETWEGWTLASVLHSWKSYTAHEANRILRRSGDFWFREYHDRFIRDDRHFTRAIEYIEANPLKAGLVDTKEAWRWSSAWHKEENKDKEEAGGTPALPG